MKQEVFQAVHEEEWAGFERYLARRLVARKKTAKAAAFGTASAETSLSDAEFPAAYRRVCQQLALAERRAYSILLLRRLQDLAQRGHQLLYRPPTPRLRRVLDFFAAEFPQLVRAQGLAMTASALLFFGPLIGVLILLQYRPELVHTVFSPEQLASFEAMYDPASPSEKLGRGSGTDLMMFGHYILNNVSIGFRTFASGLLAGVGSVFVLIFNGVFIGGIAGHLTAIGYGGPFWRFVAGHSAPELISIVISGGAGLQIGMALIAPGRRTRGRALVEAGLVGAKLILGVFVLLVFAAFVEAYWSSIAWMPAPVKFGVGLALWLGILLWLWRGGRGRTDLPSSRDSRNMV